MARDLEEHGLAFLKRGETSQSLALSDLFVVKDGIVTPTPKVEYEECHVYPDWTFLCMHLMTCFAVSAAS